MPTESWPAALEPRTVLFHPDVPAKTGGPTLTGSEQVVASTAGRWRGRVSLTIGRPASSPAATLLAYRALLAYMQGGTNPILIGPFDAANAPGFLADGGSTSATNSGGASVGASSMNISMSGGRVPQAGQYFGFGERLYIIQQAGVGSPTGSVYPVTFWPPLRVAVSNGATCLFTSPVCKMRMLRADTGELDLYGRFQGDVSLDLIEDDRA